MIITDANWEKRNLNVETIEIKIEKTDDIDNIKDIILSNEKQYSVVRIDSDNYYAVRMIQQCGYSYIETAFSVEGKVKNLCKLDVYKRFDNYLSNVVADESMVNDIRKIVETGKIFLTDRIAIDPYFSPQIAGIRYSNWIWDEYKKGATIYVTYYKKVPVFFTAVKKISDDVYHSFIGGSLPGEYTGLGFAGMYLLTDEIKKLNGKKIITGISSNNLPIIRLHIDMGYSIVGSESVFVKHK